MLEEGFAVVSGSVLTCTMAPTVQRPTFIDVHQFRRGNDTKNELQTYSSIAPHARGGACIDDRSTSSSDFPPTILPHILVLNPLYP